MVVLFWVVKVVVSSCKRGGNVDFGVRDLNFWLVTVSKEPSSCRFRSVQSVADCQVIASEPTQRKIEKSSQLGSLE